MLMSLSLLPLIMIFTLAAAAVWFAGVKLSSTIDVIDSRFNLGQALGGLIFLAIATNLPEIAIVVTASLKHNIGIAIGNILGGIAIQTVVLVLLDGIGLGKKAGLSYQSASLQLVLEGILVISILVIAIMGSQLPETLIFNLMAPADFLILFTWILGLYLINKARTGLPWHGRGHAPNTIHLKRKINQEKKLLWSSTHLVLSFGLAALITLIAGVVLEESSIAIAHQIGWSGVLFGSTILAAATALPEISTGIAAIKLGDYTLAFSDIFGGNAFLPVLFLPATLLSGQSALPLAQKTDIYLAGLGVLLTAIYIVGLIFRPKTQFFRLGIDSISVLLMYILGICGLFFISGA